MHISLHHKPYMLASPYNVSNLAMLQHCECNSRIRLLGGGAAKEREYRNGYGSWFMLMGCAALAKNANADMYY